MKIFPLPFKKLQCTTMWFDYHSTFGIAWDSFPPTEGYSGNF